MSEAIKQPLYRERLAEQSALWADLYALTMAQALFTHGKHNTRATFHSYIRKNPFGGEYLITAGQNILFEWLKNWSFDDDDLLVLKNKQTPNPKTGQMERLFGDEFLALLKDAKMDLTIDAMTEGEIAFPKEPIVRVSGPLWQCLLIEAALLNIINSQSLFATLASRLMTVTDQAMVLEFGLRRAQGIGGLEPARGAYVGGISATSNMLAEKYYGIPSAGTFAHAFVMAYESELDAFKDYAMAMPNNSLFLVDTYDTIEGVRHAIQVCQELDVHLKGIRLDSGDLVELSKQARVVLDEAGFTDALITASNDLEEKTIANIRAKGGKIDVWGVGTNLVTAKAQPALGAVYKLGSIENIDGTVRDVIKISEDSIKTTLPGALDVLRFYDDRGFTHDIICEQGFVPKTGTFYQPLQRIFDQGKLVGLIETVHEARDRAKQGLDRLGMDYTCTQNAKTYQVKIEEGLKAKKEQMITRCHQKKKAA